MVQRKHESEEVDNVEQSQPERSIRVMNILLSVTKTIRQLRDINLIQEGSARVPGVVNLE